MEKTAIATQASENTVQKILACTNTAIHTNIATGAVAQDGMETTQTQTAGAIRTTTHTNTAAVAALNGTTNTQEYTDLAQLLAQSAARLTQEMETIL